MTTSELYQEHFECVCGIHLITLERFGDDTDTDIVFWEQPYYSGGKLREYFRRLWAALRNKRYMIYNIILSQGDAKRLARMLLEVTESEEWTETHIIL